MALINNNFMADVGLDAMPPEEKAAFMSQAQEELEVRVGRRISEGMSEAQLQEFDSLTDPEAVTAWLEQNAPNFRQVVRETFEAFRAEIMAESANILGT